MGRHREGVYGITARLAFEPDGAGGATIVANLTHRGRAAARTPRSRVPTSVPEVVFSDQRLANGLRVIVAEDHLAPVVAINLWYDVGSKHEVAGQDGLRPPLRARHVPGLAPRRQGRARGHRPGGRRHDERLDLAGPDQLLRDDAGPPDGAGAVARGRPDGHPARGPEPGEPGQPARGRQEREALVLRQPAVRLVAGEAPGPPLPAGAPVPPFDDRLDGRSRRRVARGRQRLLPDLLRAEQRGRSRSSATSTRPRCWQRRSATSAGSRPTRTSRRWATCRSR